MVLARVHEPVDGMDISADEKVEDRLGYLLSTPEASNHPSFACFSCPDQATSFDKFSQHCQSKAHQKAISGKATKFLDTLAGYVRTLLV